MRRVIAVYRQAAQQQMLREFPELDADRRAFMDQRRAVRSRDAEALQGLIDN